MNSRWFFRVLSTALLALTISFSASAQTGEHIVILWDVTGSLLPESGKVKDLDGTILRNCPGGNGLWVELKKAVIECIEYTEEDPNNRITVVTFNDNIRDIFSYNTTYEEKQMLIDKVRKYPYEGHKTTNIVEPLKKFYALINSKTIDYMFLFTDGNNDNKSTEHQFIPTLKSWNNHANGRHAYGFYVLVHNDAGIGDVINAVESQNNFWVVPNAKVRVKVCTLPTSIDYNIRDEKDPIVVNIKGKYEGAKGNIAFDCNDPYYNIECHDADIKDGKFKLKISPKPGVSAPDEHIVNLCTKASGADEYTFIAPNVVQLNISNKPERSLNLVVEDKNFGDVQYYEPIFNISKDSKPIEVGLDVDFSDQAQKECSSAIMRVCLVDKSGDKTLSFDSQNLKLCINGEERDEITLTPDMTSVRLTICGNSKTKDSKYYGRIELLPSNLEHCTINKSKESFKFKFDFERKWHPLKVCLVWVFIILMSALLLWVFLLQRLLFPRFGAAQKVFNIPGMAPLIIRFKGARCIVVSNVAQKKQSAWNRFWTGPIRYVIHPAFTSPIVMSPLKRRRILVKCDGSVYKVMPNPMPYIGPATIDNNQTKIHITIN